MPEPAWLTGSDSSKSETPSTPPAAPAASPSDAPQLTLNGQPDAPTQLSDSLAADDSTPSDAPKAGEQQNASKADAKDGDKPDGATPYEAFKLPEGLQISDAHQTALTEFGQANSLSQEAMQQIVDFGVEVEQMTRAAIEQESEQGVSAMHAEWRKQLNADPELGGPKLKETQANLDTFQKSALADPGLLKFLSESNLVINPHIARLLSRIGASLKEQPVSLGGDAPKPDRNPAREIYNKSGHV